MSTFAEIRTIANRARSTLLHDAVGGGALFVMLLVSLYVPGFF